MESLGNQILDIIEEVTCCEYIGKLEVITDDGNVPDCSKCSNKEYIPKNYTLNLYLNMYMSPMVFYYEGTEEGFKEFIREEIKRRKLEKVLRYEVIRELPAIEECNETEGN